MLPSALYNFPKMFLETTNSCSMTIGDHIHLNSHIEYNNSHSKYNSNLQIILYASPTNNKHSYVIYYFDEYFLNDSASLFSNYTLS